MSYNGMTLTFSFVAGNPLPCNRIEPLASSPAIVALCIGGFFGSDLATCIFETPTTFEELPIEAFCNCELMTILYTVLMLKFLIRLVSLHGFDSNNIKFLFIHCSGL